MLSDVLNITTKEVISLVGGGGKTTTLLRLAEEFKFKFNRKVIITTTTKIYRSSVAGIELIIGDNAHDVATKIESSEEQVITVASGINKEDKLLGLNSHLIDQLQQVISDFPVFIVEADGAAGKDFKVPNVQEPVVPISNQLLLPIVGSRIIEKDLTGESLYRSSLLSKLDEEFKDEDSITPRLIVEILLDEAGYDLLKKQQDCSVIPLINQVDKEVRYDFALKVAKKLLKAGLNKVVLTTVKRENPVVEVIE